MLHIKNEILSKRHFDIINYATFSRNIDTTITSSVVLFVPFGELSQTVPKRRLWLEAEIFF